VSKVRDDLKRLYDGALDEPIPQEWKELLDKLK
jgi:hypothetical protein